MCRTSVVQQVAQEADDTFDNAALAEADAERDVALVLAQDFEDSDPQRAKKIRHPGALDRLARRDVAAAANIRTQVELEPFSRRDPERRKPAERPDR